MINTFKFCEDYKGYTISSNGTVFYGFMLNKSKTEYLFKSTYYNHIKYVKKEIDKDMKERK
jgi:hypothetical protein